MADLENIADKILNKYPNHSRDTLIPILQDFQDMQGYIDESTIKLLSDRFDLPTSKIYGLVTFYNQFKLQPRGKYHIQLCNGSACHLNKSSRIIKKIEKELSVKEGETSRDKKFSLEILPCIGACGQSPVMAINGEYFTKLTLHKLKEIISQYREKEVD